LAVSDIRIHTSLSYANARLTLAIGGWLEVLTSQHIEYDAIFDYCDGSGTEYGKRPKTT